MDVLSLRLSRRVLTRKKVKTLRRRGVVPVHVYGTKATPIALQVEAPILRRLLPRVGTNIPLSVEIEGQEGPSICFVREIQRHPVTEDLLHVDFMRVDVSQTIRSEVPVLLDGNPPAVQDLSGTLLQPLQTVLVESLPMNVPTSIRMDVSGLDDFEKAVYVRDVSVGSGVTIITDADDLIARVNPPRIEVVEEPAAGEGIVDAEEGVGAEADGASLAEADSS